MNCRFASHILSKQQTANSKQLIGIDWPLLISSEAAIGDRKTDRMFAACRLLFALLKYSRQPVHDVERQLSIVDPRAVHAELHLLRAGTHNLR